MSSTTGPRRTGGMHGGPGMPDMMGRMMEIVETFRDKGATSPDTALGLKELGVPPMFEMMLQGPMGKMGPFREHQGRYYLSEERLEEMRERFGSR